ncbi:MAG TPA: hypothetical protein VGM17_17430, partial [Rhizomicrobium sp.]
MTSFSKAFVVSGCLVLAIAQPAFCDSKPLDAVTRDAALHKIEDTIRTAYVFPELKTPLVEKLEQGRVTHRYDADDADA